uniref:BPTI/Kunitz inhibitor domain-containing protein n=1 Tax=Panagrellus redivivus TaxID=6233 RepID=A0A7E4UXF3_PANRE
MKSTRIFLVVVSLSCFLHDVQAIKCYTKLRARDTAATSKDGYTHCESHVFFDGSIHQIGWYSGKETMRECTRMVISWNKLCNTDLCNTPCQQGIDEAAEKKESTKPASSPKSTSSAYILISTIVMILGVLWN